MKCIHDPTKIEGAIGQYHCPGCGEMVIAGIPHLDYDLLNNLTEEDIKVIAGKETLLDEQWKNAKAQVDEGWHELLDDLRKNLDEITKEKEKLSDYTGYSITQVKEKFGGLRVHIDKGVDTHLKMIEYFEGLSYHICEECGMYGKVRNDLVWKRALCNKCYEQLNKKEK